ncbi:MAG: sulfatase-like hydrolase/transferase, partial [Smithella sp.]
LSVFCYVFMEFMFYFTKLSFLNFMNIVNRISLLFLSNLALFLTTLPLLLILYLSSKTSWGKKIIQYLIGAYLLVPSFFLSTMSLLLVDNLTYTVFGIGIVTAYGLPRIIYLIVYLIVFSIIYIRQFTGLSNPSLEIQSKKAFWPFTAVITLTLAMLLIRTDWSNEFNLKGISYHPTSKPNIILLGSDGLNASNMSVYGYSKNTTPFLNEFAKRSLFATNAFTNSAKSEGSIVSIFTSKTPFETRVIHYPDILQGIDEYEHLPGILHDQGYLTVQIGLQDYVDANAANLRNGFDIVNGKHTITSILSLLNKFDVDNLPYFLRIIFTRASDRLLHIFYLRDMPNPYNFISFEIGEKDLQSFDQIIKFMESTNQPIFIQAHLLGTHFPYATFAETSSTMVSENKNPDEEAYDNAIYHFDSDVRKLVRYLEDSGKISNTILVIYSDHGNNWTNTNKIPLIIHFPNDEFKGIVKENVQNIDIAPTILNYMKLQVPDWMNGNSLIGEELSPVRPIFSANLDVYGPEEGLTMIKNPPIDPPFYQFRYLTTFICQSRTSLDLSEKVWMQSTVEAYDSPCNPDSLPKLAEIQKIALDQLSENGYDISSLQGDLPVMVIDK